MQALNLVTRHRARRHALLYLARIPGATRRSAPGCRYIHIYMGARNCNAWRAIGYRGGLLRDSARATSWRCAIYLQTTNTPWRSADRDIEEVLPYSEMMCWRAINSQYWPWWYQATERYRGRPPRGCTILAGRKNNAVCSATTLLPCVQPSRSVSTLEHHLGTV